MNKKGFGSFNFLKLKYRKEDQIIQLFSRIGFPKKLGPLSWISENFQNMGKVLLNYVETNLT